MTAAKSKGGVVRMLALGLALVLGAYWAGSRWGQRQPNTLRLCQCRLRFRSLRAMNSWAMKCSLSRFAPYARRR
jgi:hypothetical protein